MFLGAGELPRRLVFSCVCWDGTCCARGGCRAGLRLRPWWQAVWFAVCVVFSLAACVAPNSGVASLRRVLCGWPALVGWRFLCVCAFDGFLLWVRIAYACPTIASLCNILQGFRRCTLVRAEHVVLLRLLWSLPLAVSCVTLWLVCNIHCDTAYYRLLIQRAGAAMSGLHPGLPRCWEGSLTHPRWVPCSCVWLVPQWHRVRCDVLVDAYGWE